MTCTHVPRCDVCVVCGATIPQYKDFGDDPTPDRPYVVELENGTRSHVPARSEAEAIDLAVTGAARSARLCRHHVVRALKVSLVDRSISPGDHPG